MRTIYLIRHCKAYGQETDADLTSEGYKQSEILSQWLSDKGITQIYASPYLRAIKSVQIFSDLYKIPIRIDSRLRERVLSSWDLPDWVDKLKATFEDHNLWFEGGESSIEAAKRGLEVINEALIKQEETVALVTHGNLLALMIGNYHKDFGFEDWKAMSNPDVYVLKIDQGKSNIERIWK
ncbi:histidine phosphatase family protein [Fontibacillus sp. BL9]|uniref:histidine phosphatase family protein n=1 Tax=Fontibacillus sp. BL9 TaxID=3389971 RepID=UPI003978718C